MKNSYIILALTALLFSCNTVQEEKPVIATNNSPAQVIANENPDKDLIVVQEVVEQKAIPTPPKCSSIGAQVYTDAEPVTHVAYDVNDKIIDSLNKIIPLYDTTIYSKMAVSYFTSLAKDLHGRAFFTPDADSLVNVIMEILSTRINDGSDIVFLIDKTSSMEDDIAKVRKSMDLILDYLKQFDNVKVAIAEYGDKNWQYDFWYNSTELSNDIEGMKSFLNENLTLGNPDIPESVNDAIVKTVTEMNWTEGNKRLMLVIGDAPSQEGSLSEYTQEQVIEKCDSMNVKFNLYPVIISLSPAQRVWVNPFVQRDFLTTYPNPVNDYLNVELDANGFFYYQVNDLNGRLVLQGSVANKKDVIPVYSLTNGNYLLQIYDQTYKNYNTKMIVVQHN